MDVMVQALVRRPMSVSKESIQKCIDDYLACTGNETDRFICPITLQPVPTDEVIRGHLLNKGFFEASGRTVPQWKKVDGFFGEAVEPDLIDHLNLKDKTDEDLLSGADEFYVEFTDGSRADAFSAGSNSGKAVKDRFPKVPFRTGQGTVEFYIKVQKDDSRLLGRLDLRRTESFYPSHWLAAGLKSAYLTVFSIFGYKVCFDPMTGALRQSLASFYETKGEAGAEQHFKEFRNAFRIMGLYNPTKKYQPSADYVPYAFDTIGDNEFLSYDAIDGTHFAIGVLFKINGMTVIVALPSYRSPNDAAKVWAMYQNFMSETPEFRYTISRTKFTGDKWLKIGEPIPHKLFETLPTGTIYLSQ